MTAVVQIPRLYDIYKAQGIIENFEQLLENIFIPLFEVTVNPNTHPQLHLFLKTVSPPAQSLVTSTASILAPFQHQCFASSVYQRSALWVDLMF